MKGLSTLVELGERSELKTDLNLGVVSLASADSFAVRPHLCLNGVDGSAILNKVTARSNTEFFMFPNLVQASDDIWLNVSFSAFVDELSSKSQFNLTPRQTGYIVQHLPESSRSIVLDKVKRWYTERVVTNLQKGIERITEQFKTGDPLLASDRENRIFDIHGGRAMDVPYTEIPLIGREVYFKLIFGPACHDLSQDFYAIGDSLLAFPPNPRREALMRLREPW